MFGCTIGDGDYDVLTSNSTEEFLKLELKADSGYYCASLPQLKELYTSDLRRLRNEIKMLETESNAILPQITNAENELKQLEDKTQHQEKTLKLVLNRCEEELNKAVQIRDASKNTLRELDRKLIELDLKQAIDDAIANANVKNISRKSKTMIASLLKMETLMNGLLEKAESLKSVMVEEKPESDKIAICDLKWLLWPGIFSFHNFIDSDDFISIAPELEQKKT